MSGLNKKLVSCKQGSAESVYCIFSDENIDFSVSAFDSWGFEMYNPSGTKIVDDTATIYDADKNIVRYDLSSAQTATSGNYKAYFVGVSGDSKTYFPKRGNFTVQVDSL